MFVVLAFAVAFLGESTLFNSVMFIVGLQQ